MSNSPILIIDDDKNIRTLISDYLKSENYYVLSSDSAEAGLDILKEDKIQVVIVDLFLPNASGFELINKWKRVNLYDINFIVITAQGTTKNAIEAMKTGAFDYLVKPFDLDELGIVVKRALSTIEEKEELAGLKKTLNEEHIPNELIVGQSKIMQNVYKEIGKISHTDVTVLIEGESGTGKELIAKTIHFNSTRLGKPFVAINTAAIPENLLESEFFGHEEGAYTGASSKVQGKFQAADGGTIFLDEIGEIPLSFQTKLLRVIEEKKVTPLGSTKPIDVNVRIIAATNKNLEQLVKEQKFREDLYYRLKVFYIQLPTLNERADDIPLLINHFQVKFINQYQLGEKQISVDAINFLKEIKWKGNVRELENTLLRILISTTGDIISLNDVRNFVGKVETVSNKDLDKKPLSTLIYEFLAPIIKKMNYEDFDKDFYKSIIEEVDKALLTLALRKTKGNQVKAAALLGINRNTIRKKINDLKLKDFIKGE